MVEIVDLFPTTLELLGLNSSEHVHDFESLEGTSFAPLIANPSIPVSKWKNATFTQYPRCTSGKDLEPWEYPTKNPCTTIDSSKFSVMGYSIRSDRWRYTLWLKWDGKKRQIAGWHAGNVVGEELYDHEGDDGMDTDAFENENVAADNPGICAIHKSALIAGWKAAKPAI